MTGVPVIPISGLMSSVPTRDVGTVPIPFLALMKLVCQSGEALIPSASKA
jgi:hypothetical protein